MKCVESPQLKIKANHFFLDFSVLYKKFSNHTSYASLLHPNAFLWQSYNDPCSSFYGYGKIWGFAGKEGEPHSTLPNLQGAHIYWTPTTLENWAMPFATEVSINM